MLTESMVQVTLCMMLITIRHLKRLLCSISLIEAKSILEIPERFQAMSSMLEFGMVDQKDGRKLAH